MGSPCRKWPSRQLANAPPRRSPALSTSTAIN